MTVDLSAKEKAELLKEVGRWSWAKTQTGDVPLADVPQESYPEKVSSPPVSVPAPLAKGTSRKGHYSGTGPRQVGSYTKEERQRGAASTAAGKRGRVSERIEATLPEWIAGRDKFVASEYIRATFPDRCVQKFRRTYKDLMLTILARVAPVLAQKWLSLREMIRKAMALKRGVGYMAGRVLAEWAAIGRRMGSHPATTSKRFVADWVPDLRGWFERAQT